MKNNVVLWKPCRTDVLYTNYENGFLHKKMIFALDFFIVKKHETIPKIVAKFTDNMV